MNRNRSLAVGIVVMAALLATTVAQQASTPADHPHGLPTVESHLKVLAEKLDLTTDQQAKAKPILQEMHDSMGKLAQNENLSAEDRTNQHRTIFEKADKQLRVILTDVQKSKLDQIEQEQHNQPHGSAN